MLADLWTWQGRRTVDIEPDEVVKTLESGQNVGIEPVDQDPDVLAKALTKHLSVRTRVVEREDGSRWILILAGRKPKDISSLVGA